MLNRPARQLDGLGPPFPGEQNTFSPFSRDPIPFEPSFSDAVRERSFQFVSKIIKYLNRLAPIFRVPYGGIVSKSNRTEGESNDDENG
jgi:hypothetical protein